jgi:TetR/AcrR family transcriptional regulator
VGEIKIDPQKYARILQSSLQQFAKYGYQQTNTEEIAAGAGVSKGLIFHYFGSKQKLYEQTISFVIDHLNEQSKALFERDYTDLVEIVVVSTKHKLDIERVYPDHIHLLISSYAQKEMLPKGVQEKLNQYMAENMAIAQQLLTKSIKRMPIKESISEQDVIQLVLGVFNQIYVESLTFLRENPSVTEIHQMQFLVERSRSYMAILQTGFLEQ